MIPPIIIEMLEEAMKQGARFAPVAAVFDVCNDLVMGEQIVRGKRFLIVFVDASSTVLDFESPIEYGEVGKKEEDVEVPLLAVPGPTTLQ